MDEFPRISRLPPYVFNIVNELKAAARAQGEDIIDFGMGNPDQPTPPHIVAKLLEVAQRKDSHRYSSSRGIPRLRRAICNWYQERFQVELNPETEAIVTIGSKEGLAHLALATLGPGDNVLVPNPAYPIHTYSVVIAGADVRHVPLVAHLDFFEELKKVRVFVLGTGEMATQVAKALVSGGAYPVIVSSHHYDRAQELARLMNGEALRYDEYEQRINEADILIASTHASRFLVESTQVKHWMKLRHQKPLFLVDIAVPRNIDPEIEKLDNVYLYNIDDLKGICDKNIYSRQTQVERCEGMVKGQTEFFMSWLFKEFGAAC